MSPKHSSAPYVLIAVLASIVAAVALYLYVSVRPPGDSSVEAGFARDMAVHHAQAVEMATIVERRTRNDAVGTLARDIVLTQQAQIGQMQGWLAVWGLSQTSGQPQMSWMGHDLPPGEPMPGMASREEVNSLTELPAEEMDAEFLRLMIVHHSSSIPMSEAVLSRTSRPEVEELAGAISSSQEAEVEIMQDMLRSMGEPTVDSDSMDGMQGMEMQRAEE